MLQVLRAKLPTILIEGGLDLFQTHGTVPAEVYNTLDKKEEKEKT